MEENKQTNLADLTLIELKAISYDEIVNLNLAQNNLRVLNQELYNRQQKGVEGASPVTQN